MNELELRKEDATNEVDCENEQPNELELVKKVRVSWRETFRTIKEAGEYRIDIFASDVNNIRVAVSSLNNDEGFKFYLNTPKFVENTVFITATEKNQ